MQAVAALKITVPVVFDPDAQRRRCRAGFQCPSREEVRSGIEPLRYPRREVFHRDYLIRLRIRESGPCSILSLPLNLHSLLLGLPDAQGSGLGNHFLDAPDETHTCFAAPAAEAALTTFPLATPLSCNVRPPVPLKLARSVSCLIRVRSRTSGRITYSYLTKAERKTWPSDR